MLTAVNKVLDRVEGLAMVILMLVATVVAIIQVIARYGFNNSLYWSEETILYSLISMSFLAGSMGVRYSAHICVEVLPVMVGPRFDAYVKFLANLMGAIFAATLVYYGTRLAINTSNMGQLSPAMQVPVAYIYAMIPISGAFMCLRYLWVLQHIIQKKPFEPLKMDLSAS
ncbi:MAG TPA: TRAP transporter small permease [Burkholderiaceae bacterium]|nr:TRAP transporter small permease [Burkholderiaceae bacterium]